MSSKKDEKIKYINAELVRTSSQNALTLKLLYGKSGITIFKCSMGTFQCIFHVLNKSMNYALS